MLRSVLVCVLLIRLVGGLIATSRLAESCFIGVGYGFGFAPDCGFEVAATGGFGGKADLGGRGGGGGLEVRLDFDVRGLFCRVFIVLVVCRTIVFLSGGDSGSASSLPVLVIGSPILILETEILGENWEGSDCAGASTGRRKI
jgi:hypothetical protein